MALSPEQKARAASYRAKIRAAAQAGGHIFKQKGVGGGVTVKKMSKTGKEYYYTPWNTLTDAQKKERIAKSLEYAAKTRQMAKQYKIEHGITSRGKTV